MQNRNLTVLVLIMNVFGKVSICVQVKSQELGIPAESPEAAPLLWSSHLKATCTTAGQAPQDNGNNHFTVHNATVLLVFSIPRRLSSSTEF